MKGFYVDDNGFVCSAEGTDNPLRFRRHGSTFDEIWVVAAGWWRTRRLWPSSEEAVAAK